jgi:hypothetical protein
MPPSKQSVPSNRETPGERNFTKRARVLRGAHAAVWRLFCGVFEILARLPRQEVSDAICAVSASRRRA